MDPDAGKPEGELQAAGSPRQSTTTDEEVSTSENVDLQQPPEHLTSSETGALPIASNVENMDTEETSSGQVIPTATDVNKCSENIPGKVESITIVQTQEGAVECTDKGEAVENVGETVEMEVEESEATSNIVAEGSTENIDTVIDKPGDSAFKDSSEDLNKNIELELKSKLEHALVELENAKIQIQQLNKQNVNLECFRKQRDSAVEERNGLLDIITQLNKKMQHLEDTKSQSSVRLNNTIESNCEIVAKNCELQTKELALKYKEELLDQDRIILYERISNLMEALNKANLDLETSRISYNSKISNLEIQLSTKTQELEISDEHNTYLKSDRQKLIREVGNLEKKLLSQRETHDKTCQDLQNKLYSKTKAAELYQSMRDDSNLKCAELEHGAAELQQLLKESLEKYGNLGLKNMQNELQYESTIHLKNTEINSLKRELEVLKNECSKLKADSVNLGLSHISPTICITKDFLKSGKSLAEIYGELVSVSEELARKNEENRQVKKELADLMSALQESAPYIKKCKLQYDEISNDHSVISHQLESVEAEYKQLREDYAEAVKLTNLHERENKRLREQLNDLNQQVCFLLKELDLNSSTGHHNSSLHNNIDDSRATSSSLITNNLVTFADIQQLQLNNQKLLKIVRELTEKQEEIECFKEQIESGELQKKLEILTGKVSELQSSNECQSRQLKSAIKQRDMYKQLYHDKANIDLSIENSVEKMDESEVNEKHEDKPDIKFLESTLEDTKKQIEQYKEDQTKLVKHYESKTQLLLVKIDKLTKDWDDINQKYKICIIDSKKKEEHSMLLQRELSLQKDKVTDLQNKTEKMTSKIAEYENTIKFLSDAATNSNNKLNHAEIMLKTLEKECVILRDSHADLRIEKDRLLKEMQEQNLLLNNIQIIENLVENKNNMDKSNLENKLDNFSRECSMLQSKLEQQTSLLKSHPNNLKDVGEEVTLLRRDLEEKIKLIEELHSSSSNAQVFTEDIKKLNDLLTTRETEIKSLKYKFNNQKDYVIKIEGMLEFSAKNLTELEGRYVQKESQMSSLEKLVEELKDRSKELETELSLHNNSQYEINNKLKAELAQAQDAISSLTNDLQIKMGNLDDAEIKILELTDDLKLMQENNVDKDRLFNQNVQIIASLNRDIEELRNEMMDVRNSSLQAEKKLDDCRIDWEKRNGDLEREKDTIASQLEDSQRQNSLLLEQLELFNSQNAVMSHHQTETMNESLTDSSMNVSSSENDLKSISKLTQIINYIRKERDTQCTKFNVLQEENLKIKVALQLAENTINDMKIKSTDNASGASMAKHVDVVKKLEMFNTISHNNILLREERDSLLVRVNELSSTLTKVEESLLSLQQKNDELSKRINNLMFENSSVQTECNRWKSRFNSLSEKANKTNLEDWKRLQSEREALAKMLTGEKETLKKVRDEMLINKLEKSKFEEQNNQLNKKHQNLSEEIKKQVNENNNLKKELNQTSTELNLLKTAVVEKTNEINKLNEDLITQTKLYKESRDKELTLRRIAKNFKTERDVLKLAEEKRNAEQQGSEQSSKIDNDTKNEQKLAEIEKTYNDKISELETNTVRLANENDSLQLEINNLETKIKEIEDNAKEKLIEVNDMVVSMNESNECLKNKLEEANTENIKLLALKSKLENEKDKAVSVQQEEVLQLNKQIETLTQKVNVMQKQIDIQPAKSSMSSNQGDKSTVDPPTANIKPMSGSQQPIGSRRTAGETPLASIKPMTSGVRTAAVLPNAQYSTATTMHHHSLHTSVNTPVEVVSSLPSSSHIVEHLSSGSLLSSRHPVSPYSMSTSDTDPDPIEKAEVSNANIVTLLQTGIPQTVALVTPRMETSTIDSSIVDPQPALTSNVLSSTVSTSYGNSNVGGDQALLKRQRTEAEQDKSRQKKQKLEVDSTEGESEYQLPSSSQHQEDDEENIQEDDEMNEEVNEEMEDEEDEEGEEQEEEEQEQEEEEEEQEQEQIVQENDDNDQDDDPVIILESDEEEGYEDKEKYEEGTDEESVESEGEEEVVEEEDVSNDDDSDDDEEQGELEIDEAGEGAEDVNEESQQGEKYADDDNDIPEYQGDEYGMRIEEGNAAAAALQGYDDQNEEDPES